MIKQEGSLDKQTKGRRRGSVDEAGEKVLKVYNKTKGGGFGVDEIAARLTNCPLMMINPKFHFHLLRPLNSLLTAKPRA